MTKESLTLRDYVLAAGVMAAICAVSVALMIWIAPSKVIIVKETPEVVSIDLKNYYPRDNEAFDRNFGTGNWQVVLGDHFQLRVRLKNRPENCAK